MESKLCKWELLFIRPININVVAESVRGCESPAGPRGAAKTEGDILRLRRGPIYHVQKSIATCDYTVPGSSFLLSFTPSSRCPQLIKL